MSELIETFLVGLCLWAVAELLGLRWQYETDNVRPWVQTLRTHWIRWPVKTVLAFISGLVATNWFHTVALPNLRNGPKGWIALGLIVFVGAGLGVMLAKHTMTDYRMLKNE